MRNDRRIVCLGHRKCSIILLPLLARLFLLPTYSCCQLSIASKQFLLPSKRYSRNSEKFINDCTMLHSDVCNAWFYCSIILLQLFTKPFLLYKQKVLKEKYRLKQQTVSLLEYCLTKEFQSCMKCGEATEVWRVSQL